MPKISDLFVYPVKSCAGVRMNEVSIVPTGFAFDRNWMVVDADGNFVTQREQSTLALVKPQLNGGITLTAPDMEPLHVAADAAGEPVTITLFGETHGAMATTPEADAWFSKYLGGKFRLVKCDPAKLRKGGVQYPQRDDAPTSFVDNYGVLVISQASHAALNQKLPHEVPMNRFRPNIVVGGVEEHDEDYFTNARCGDVALRFVNPCYRCSLTSIDQQSAMPGLDVLPTLSTYRYDESVKGVKFGAYAAISAGIGSALRIDSDLDVDWSF
jgi:MOSC domain-containing protein